jgi:hypothetical protein
MTGKPSHPSFLLILSLHKHDAHKYKEVLIFNEASASSKNWSLSIVKEILILFA